MQKLVDNHQALIRDLLPQVIIDRNFNNLPKELRKVYQEKTDKGQSIAVGLKAKLGFYLVEYKINYKAELVWSEN